MTARARPAVIARGLASLAGILLIVAGLPIALAVLGGNPFPEQVPSSEEVIGALTRPDDGTLLIGLLTVIGWAVWATLTLSFALEIPAALRGVPAPHLPGLSWQQGQAAAMTGAVAALLTIGTAAPAHAATGTGTEATATAAAAGQVAGTTELLERTSESAARQGPTAPDTGTVTVRPGDTLWQIARDHLGSGERYREILHASKAIVQPDGTRLTDPDDIHPGWHLALPAQTDATSQTSHPHRTDPTGQQDRPGQVGQAASAIATDQPSERQQRQALTDIEDRLAGGPAAEPDADRAAAEGQVEQHDVGAAAAVTGLGSVTCAGLLALLASRRSLQRRRRRPGWRIAAPTGPAAEAEAGVRALADPDAGACLDRALRDLAARTGPGGRPALRAARLGPETIEVYVVEEDLALPAPWGGHGAGVWVIERAAVPSRAAAAVTPWPALVCVGHDEDDGQVLLNLEQIAALGLTGHDEDVEAVLAALALDLVTAAWADLHVTVVAGLADLVEAVDEPRLTHAPALAPVLDRLESRQADGPPAPEVVLVAAPVHGTDADRIRALSARPHGDGPAFVTAGDAVSRWSLAVGHPLARLGASLAPVGLTITPTRLPRPGYRDLLQLIQATAAPDVPAPAWAHANQLPMTLDTIPPARTGPSLARDPAHAATVSIAGLAAGPRPVVRVLGPVEVTGAPGTPPRETAAVTELVTLIALHPGSTAPALAEALTRPEGDLPLLLDQARAWLGTAADGTARVLAAPDGGHHLSDVALDWHHARALIGTSLADADTTGLRSALTLVTAAPLDDPPAGRYTWAETDAHQLRADVADIAHEHATRSLRAGDPTSAAWASDKGLLAEPLSETLWRDAIHAAWQTGDPDGTTRAVAAARGQLGDLGPLEHDARRITEQTAGTP